MTINGVPINSIAFDTGKSVPRLRQILASLNIQPTERVGNKAFYSDADVARIKAYIATPHKSGPEPLYPMFKIVSRLSAQIAIQLRDVKPAKDKAAFRTDVLGVLDKLGIKPAGRRKGTEGEYDAYRWDDVLLLAKHYGVKLDAQ